MIGFYNYTVILTYVGMLSGFLGIAAAAAGNLQAALLYLMASGFCDMFDGKIAATMERTDDEKRFGIQIDSLSDLICFGVLPALIVHQAVGSGLWISALYVLCALIRLAWFNVDEEQRQTKSSERRTEYLGLPVTTAALIFPITFCLGRILNLPLRTVAPVILAATAAAFLIPFRLKKPRLTKKLGIIVLGSAELMLLLVCL